MPPPMPGMQPPSAGPQPSPGPGTPSPAAAVTTTPEQPKGEQASADAKVEAALRMLEQAFAAYGGKSAKGKCIFESLGKLRKEFKGSEDRSSEILPAELKSALLAPSVGGSGGGGAAQPGTPQQGQPPAQAA